MRNQNFNRMINHYLPMANSNANHNQSIGYFWFFLAVVLVAGFMILSNMGIAS